MCFHFIFAQKQAWLKILVNHEHEHCSVKHVKTQSAALNYLKLNYKHTHLCIVAHIHSPEIWYHSLQQLVIGYDRFGDCIILANIK